MKFDQRRTVFLAAILALLAMAATPAFGANYYQCQRDLISGDELTSCQGFDLSGPTTVDVPADILEFRGGVAYLCKFQFWSYDGRAYFADDMQTDFEPPESGSRTATAWFTCQCDPRFNDDEVCEGGGGGGANLRAVDLNTGDFVATPWVESTDPPNAGTCATQPFCSVPSGTSELTARQVVGVDREFVAWMSGSTGRTLAPPSGFQVALYKSNPCLRTDRSTIPITCLAMPDLELPHPLVRRDPTWAPLDKICQYVVGLENCPGCGGGPRGLCPNWRVTLEGAVDDLMGYIVDRTSNQVVAEARGQNGKLSLRFKPDSRGTLDGDRYALLLVPGAERSRVRTIRPGDVRRPAPGDLRPTRPGRPATGPEGIKVSIEVESDR